MNREEYRERPTYRGQSGQRAKVDRPTGSYRKQETYPVSRVTGSERRRRMEMNIPVDDFLEDEWGYGFESEYRGITERRTTNRNSGNQGSYRQTTSTTTTSGRTASNRKKTTGKKTVSKQKMTGKTGSHTRTNQKKRPTGQNQTDRKKRRRRRRRVNYPRLFLCGIILLFFGFLACQVARRNIFSKLLPTETAAETQPVLPETEAETYAEPAVREPEQSQPVSFTITACGDCTLGTDDATIPLTRNFTSYYDANGSSYFFENVRSIFENDDLTIANFEGTLTDSTSRQMKEYVFKGPAEYTQILKDGSVEAVNLSNNHSHDYGDQGFSDTIMNLENQGIRTFGYENTALIDVKGVKVGLMGIEAWEDTQGTQEKIHQLCSKLESQGAEVLILSLHWGKERETQPSDYQQHVARFAVDRGVDLVIGNHSHVIQGVEVYQGKTILYSLGNFCFGGNTNPSDKDTFIYRQTFTFYNGEVSVHSSEIIPASVSSRSDYNNFKPTPATGTEFDRIKNKILERSALLRTPQPQGALIFANVIS